MVLDGFDLGVGALHLFVARSEEERREAVAAIGPYWDGNEVWLIASGGLLFSAFPTALAIAFSGFYLALFMLLWALILRGGAIELRNHLESPLWRTFFDAVLALSSAGLALLLGAALGNVLRGVPTKEGWFTLPLFGSLLPGPQAGILDLFTFGVAVFALAALAHHGALFLAWKTSGAVQARAERFASRLYPLVWALLLAGFAATFELVALSPSWRAAPLLAVALAALVGARVVRATRWRHRALAAFVASSTFLAFALFAVAATLYPTLLRSSDGGPDLTAARAAAGDYALGTLLGWAPVGLLLALGYFANLFRVHRGRVTAPAESTRTADTRAGR